MRLICAYFAFGVLVCGCNQQDAATRTEPDNTEVNKRDADGNTKTPFDQSNDQADIDLVAKIRSEVLKIDDLSTKGENIKIITNKGKAVLRGPVDSAAERDAIVKVANDVAGAANVTNELEVDKD